MFNVNTNLIIRKPTRAWDCVLSTCSAYTILLYMLLFVGTITPMSKEPSKYSPGWFPSHKNGTQDPVTDF